MNLISKSELARRARVSQAAVTKACRGCLKSAIAGAGAYARIDVDHPDAQAYLSRNVPQRIYAKRRDVEAERAENEAFDARVLASLGRLIAGARRARRGGA